MEVWQSREGDLINAVYYFANGESLAQLARFPQRLEAKSRVKRWYERYRIVVSEVTTTYGDDRLRFS